MDQGLLSYKFGFDVSGSISFNSSTNYPISEEAGAN